MGGSQNIGLADRQPASPCRGSPRSGSRNATRTDTLEAFDTLRGDLGGLRVRVLTIEDLCDSFGLSTCQDQGTGHTSGPGNAASSSNHNPVRIVVLVTRANGSPEPFLIPDDLTFDFQASVGTNLGIRRCNSASDQVGCAFGAGINATGIGGYVFEVHPSIPGVNWSKGTTVFFLRVTDPDGRTGVGMGEIVIPN